MTDRRHADAPGGETEGATVEQMVGGTTTSVGAGSDENQQARIGQSRLRAELESHGLPLRDLTVLAPQNDPFRVDTPAGHRDGAWLAMTAERLGLGDRTIHLRGLHYMVIGQPKPDGTPYTNTDADWTWISNTAAKAARWLGYLDFDQITDQRNAAPLVKIHETPWPRPVVYLGTNVVIPDVDEIEPNVGAQDFVGVQPYKIVMYGEKSSLEPVLAPLADRYGADLYLPTGEISDTLMHTMARVAYDDGRPMVVLTFSDADPAGYQMPISIARKLQAFQTALFPGIEFQVRRVALLPDQVREYGLPSTPLKATEKRASRWIEATGTEQTEIDALAALNPGLLQQIAIDAIEPFFDTTLDLRVRRAREEWVAQAQEMLVDAIGPQELAAFRAEAAEQLAAAQELIDQLDQALQIDASDLDLPPMDVPLAMTPPPPAGDPVIDSRWDFVEQCTRLIEAKQYVGGGS